MLDIGWSELMVIGAVALIVVGPRDLPKLLRSLGKYTAQARGMARDFQRSMEDAAREVDIAEMKELRDTAKELDSFKSMRLDDGVKPSPTKPVATPAKKPAASAQSAQSAAKTTESATLNPAPAKPAPPPPAVPAESDGG